VRRLRQLKLKIVLRRLLGMKAPPNAVLQELYTNHDYLEAYSQHTDQRVRQDPKAAVGGLWEEIGQLQFDFLVAQGLKPQHTLLDIGCGTLRGGRHFIGYLDVGNYTGMDISPEAIAYAEKLVAAEGLAEKHPQLALSRNKELKFQEFAGQTFDFLLAQSVFTHLPSEPIEKCFQHIGNIMHDDSIFYFTFFAARKQEQRNVKDFWYPFSFFTALAARYGFKTVDCLETYAHPRGQKMVALMKLVQK